ncbi:MAG: tetratricopeptide repeat protein [Salinivirgaceae bacterium]|jgi:serine phosphatase RsbU (regulator of sigma subunit)|nr:tetratricopeptide repeat protein [Salinivirgaceae bacterium]
MTKYLYLPFLFFIILFNFSLYSQINEQEILNDIAQYRIENKLSLAAEALNKLAFYYWEMEMHELALKSFEQSVVLNIEIRNSNAVKAIYSNMGMIHSDMGQPETALVFFRKSLLLSRSHENKQDIGTNLINMAVALNSLNRADEALVNLEEAVVVITELNNKNLLRTCYGMLAETYEAKGDSQKSMEYFTLYSTFQKNIQAEEIEKQNKETQEKIAVVEKKADRAIKAKEQTEEKLEVTQDSLKVSEELNQLHQLKIIAQQAELKSQRLLTLIFVIGLGFVIIVALFIFRSYRQKKKHNAVLEKRNEEIREKNHKINQSINYAKNIQGALLPEISNFSKLFPESFIFFSPRDVVSGDFYWFSEVENNGNKLSIVAAVDCTGHGVPGAFMSMLGNSFLEEIILDRGIVNPEEILEDMHKMVQSSLRQDVSGNTDGMDMVVCVYDELRKIIKFAGAVNPLVYIQDGKLDVIKGDFFGIGGQMKDAKDTEQMFVQQTIDVSNPTTCYIFSDGFADQFGGEKGGKYFSKNFRSLLFDIHEKPMDEQCKILDEKLREWHGDKYDRLDDVLVMGFKV